MDRGKGDKGDGGKRYAGEEEVLKKEVRVDTMDLIEY